MPRATKTLVAEDLGGGVVESINVDVPFPSTTAAVAAATVGAAGAGAGVAATAAAPAGTPGERAAAKARFRTLPPAPAVPTMSALLGCLRGVAVRITPVSGRGDAISGAVASLWDRTLAHGASSHVVALLSDVGALSTVAVEDVASVTILDPVVKAAFEAYLAGTVKAEADAEMAASSSLEGRKRTVLQCTGTGERPLRLSYVSRAEPWQVRRVKGVGWGGVSDRPFSLSLPHPLLRGADLVPHQHHHQRQR